MLPQLCGPDGPDAQTVRASAERSRVLRSCLTVFGLPELVPTPVPASRAALVRAVRSASVIARSAQPSEGWANERTKEAAPSMRTAVRATGCMAWSKAEPVGEGGEFRAESGAEVNASALTFQEAPVHVSVAVAG